MDSFIFVISSTDVEDIIIYGFFLVSRKASGSFSVVTNVLCPKQNHQNILFFTSSSTIGVVSSTIENDVDDCQKSWVISNCDTTKLYLESNLKIQKFECQVQNLCKKI